ncbi:MAG: maltose O-acetyltransferase [Methanocella sp. PtaU1.Bin125]|nr:MAG: maltose O-acetyltransferase [Methanocella sp. PtaU1.Bin125]
MRVDERTEKEKMLAGELYLASDPELVADRLRARRLTGDYNATYEGEPGRRTRILRELFGRLGPGAEVEPPFYCDYGYNILAGSRLYLNFGCVFLDCNRISIGDDALFGPYVQIYTASHPVDPAARRSKRELAAPVSVGNNVWIGGGVIILPGVTIGDDTTIGAGSVVAGDIPANVVAAGNPCVVKRQL